MAKKKSNKKAQNTPKKGSSQKARQTRNMRIIVAVVSVIIVLSMALSAVQNF